MRKEYDFRGSFVITRFLFLRCVGFTFFCAFLSYYAQIDGIHSCNGLLPVAEYIKKIMGHHLSAGDFMRRPSLFAFVHYAEGWLPADVDAYALALGVLSLYCGLLALLVTFGYTSNSLVLAQLFVGYLSIFNVGQTFMSFQWDILLLEAGVIATLMGDSPLNLLLFRNRRHMDPAPHSAGPIYLVRFLLFRLMVSSGLLKLFSNCPTWWSLTALHHHFQSQCLPLPLSWYAHRLPNAVLRFSVAATFFFQLPVAALLILPLRVPRAVAALLQVKLMVLIAATGNYNFFNMLTVFLCIACADDHFILQNIGVRRLARLGFSLSSYVKGVEEREPWRIKSGEEEQETAGAAVEPEKEKSDHSTGTGTQKAKERERAGPAPERKISSVSTRRSNVALAKNVGFFHLRGERRMYVFVTICIVLGFAKFGPEGLNFEKGKLPFDLRGLRTCVDKLAAPVLSIAWVSLVVTVGSASFAALRAIGTKSRTAWEGARRVSDFVWTLVVGLSSMILFTASLAPFLDSLNISLPQSKEHTGWTQIHTLQVPTPPLDVMQVKKGAAKVLPSMKLAANLYRATERFRLTSSYGLFRRMTGVGGRPELVVQGWDSSRSRWVEYDFIYKPTRVDERPAVAAPHQPRLDWQMWFAALGSPEHNRWLLYFVWKLLHADPHALALIKREPLRATEKVRGELLDRGGGQPLIQGEKFIRRLKALVDRQPLREVEREASSLESPRRAPEKIRILLYTYRFTSEWKGKEWWVRSDAREWLPAMGVNQMSGIARDLHFTGYKSDGSTDCPVNVLEDFPGWELLSGLALAIFLGRVLTQ